MSVWTRIVLCAAVAWVLLSPAMPCVGAQSAPPAEPPWKAQLARIASGRDALSVRLADVHDRLRARIAAEKPALLPRLDKPRPAAAGYGLLPVIAPDEPEITDTSPTERRFGIAELGEWLALEHGRVAELAARTEYRLSPLDKLVDSYRDREDNFRRLDSHVGYHAFWQGEVKKWPAFWARKRELYDLYRTWRAPVKDGGDRRPAEEARQRLDAEMLAFTPSPALRIERSATGGLLLPVRVSTDITDEAFLIAFAEGVERFWNGAPAMKDAGLRIELRWDRRRPEELYPEGPTRRGEHIDTARHRMRFGSAPSVLTTGGEFTHAELGTIFLDAGRMSRRALAHEFAHLLGFDDAYIRAFEGSPDDPYGVVFFEVAPFPESLLASPGQGRVTRGMVERLLVAYGGRGNIRKK